MIRKMLFVGGGVVLVGALLVGRNLFSYVRTSAGYVTDAVRRPCPSSSRSIAPGA